MNSEVDAYLNKATRGLWGKKKREVEEELGAHIQGRVNAYRMAGSSEKEAVQRTIRELGQPEKVSSGMTRLYTLPTALSLGALTLGLCLSLVLLVSQTAAQTLSSSFSWPSPACLEGKEKETCVSSEPWFTLPSLKAVLEPQGVTVKENARGVNLLFPGSSIPVILSSNPKVLADKDRKLYPKDYQPAPGFYVLSQFLSKLAQNSTLPVQVSGWQRLTVEVADVVFEVDMQGSGTQRWSYDREPGYYFYSDYFSKVLRTIALPKPQEGFTQSVTLRLNASDKSSSRKRFRLSEFEEGVYGVVTRTASTPGFEDAEYNFASDVAQSSANGNLKLRLSKTHKGFVGTPENLSTGDSLLVRLTGEVGNGKFGYEVVPPEQIGLE